MVRKEKIMFGKQIREQGNQISDDPLKESMKSREIRIMEDRTTKEQNRTHKRAEKENERQNQKKIKNTGKIESSAREQRCSENDGQNQKRTRKNQTTDNEV